MLFFSKPTTWVSESRAYNTDNTLASISFTGAAIGNLSYTWDANKNKMSETIGGVMSGYGFTAGYDADDIFYKWDALGRRVGRDDGTTNVIYFQNGQQTLANYTAGTSAADPTYNYVFASYIDEIVARIDSSSNILYYHRNQQYSITAVSDGGGSVVERYAYSAYGQVTIADASGAGISSSAIANRYTYTGREWDAGLSLYHYRARMYDAVGGRFVNRDPIRYRDGLDMFAKYFGLSSFDPTGMATATYNVYDMSVQDGHTEQTIIADIDVWTTANDSDCKDNCIEDCVGNVTVEVGFRWRGRFQHPENVASGGHICDGTDCTILVPNKNNNGKNGARKLEVPCKGGEVKGSMDIGLISRTGKLFC